MTLHIWLAFVFASTILVLIPGPTVLMVIGDRLAHRDARWWSTVLGVGAGDSVAMMASLAGAGALLRASALAFSVMKTVGGVYLLYLGVSSILNARKGSAGDAESPSIIGRQTAGRRFVKAFVVTVLNPKSILFFVAFVPQFILTRGSFVLQGSVLLITFVSLAMMNASLYSFTAGMIGNRLMTASAQRKVSYAGGATLIAAGTLTLALKHR